MQSGQNYKAVTSFDAEKNSYSRDRNDKHSRHSRGGLASRGQIDRSEASERVGCSFEHAPVFVGQTYSVMKVEGISRVDGVQSLNFERQLMGNTLQVRSGIVTEKIQCDF